MLSENNLPRGRTLIRNTQTMSDILYLLTTGGFFALMIVFVWACEKV